MTSAIPVHRSTNWANKATWNWLLYCFQINPWSGEKTAVNVWKSYIWTADKDVNMKVIFAVNAAMIVGHAFLEGFSVTLKKFDANGSHKLP